MIPSARPHRRRWFVAGAAFVALLVGFALGPRVRFEERWVDPELPEDLDRYLDSSEARVPDLRPGDQREIVWFDADDPQPTPVSLVYLHGFSADRHEIEPVVSELASELGANVYFARLRGHGRDGGAMAEATVEAWLDDTAEAVAIGERIGETVVLVGTSTGATLALWAGGRPEADGRLGALVLISPNLQPRDRTSRVLLYPWGGRLAEVVVGPERCFTPENERQERHWTTCYPTSVLPVMMALVERVRTGTRALEVPLMVLYSPQDGVVDQSETERYLERVAPGSVRRVVTGSADPSSHVLAGDIVSPTSNAEVRRAVLEFLAEALPGPTSSRRDTVGALPAGARRGNTP